MEDPRLGKYLLRDLNNTFISLIPKQEKICSFEDFRPISLCNTIYKIMFKVMANRFKGIFPSIIFEK